MIKYILTIAMFTTFSVWGQNYGEPIDKNSGFSVKLKKASVATQSISCDFDQTKHMAILANAVTSKGKFYYKQKQNICLEYSIPKGNAIVMSGGKFKIVNAGKATILDNKANPMMKQLSGMLTACMTGDVDMFGTEATTTYYESANRYTVVINPTSKRVKAYIRQIILSFDKQDMTLSTMRMNENDTDYTIYEFKKKKINEEVPEDKFKI